MSEVINFKQARKKLKRNRKENESRVQRLKFGASKAEKSVITLETERLTRKLDGHKCDDDENPKGVGPKDVG